ncbi:LacI family DNA-binding transcriptional regulator [Faecalicatena contorta]|uniref:LacI family DNA-binding transcriptional regulator n=1 Tax=Faecalicatena contorta TaxID=39482 RepID=UPI001899DB2E|nr:LacI family DNA-binding transcriptional regulator [Faecalicatena contorta]
MSTLKEVAEMAGVSVSTVSYVLSGKKKVRPETLKRIEDAIDALDYCPNLLASSLKTNQSKTIGVVVSDLKNLFFVDILKSMEDELAKAGYCMTVCNADNDGDKEKKCLRRLLSRNIDGLILISTGNSDLSNYQKVKLPFICIDRIPGENFFTVRVDHILGGRLATEYLLTKGYKKILYFGNPEYSFSCERYQGYEEAMKLAGLSDYIKKIDMKTLAAEEAFRLTEELILEKEGFDAVFGGTDYIAIGVLKALLHHGIAVPGEVGVIGYDDIEPARFTYPELTTVAQPKKEIGAMAVQCLLEILKGKTLKEKQILLMPEIVVRSSC